MNLPESGNVSQSMDVTAPQLANTSLIWSSVTLKGRLPTKTRSIGGSVAAWGVEAGPFLATGFSSGSSSATRFLSFLSFFFSFLSFFSTSSACALASFFVFLAALVLLRAR